jgi:imidazolonepropionase-like amidohydrolase
MVRLHCDEGAALDEAVRLVTLNPARALGLDDAIGSLEAGKRADVVVVGWAGAMPVVTRTIRDGREVFVAGYPSRRRSTFTSASLSCNTRSADSTSR